MKNLKIVTTTINSPTKATIKFCEISEKKGFDFIIIGDKKTPHEEYQILEKNYKRITYLSPEQQENLYPNLSKLIGWNTIQRRNIGFVYAYDTNCDILATVDDDNIPYDYWGDNILIDKEIEVDLYNNILCPYFDPISVTEHKDLWHRGYPIEFLPIKNNTEYFGKVKITPLVQADFWDGDPDIDAICRLSKKPIIKFNHFEPFTTNQLTPFNSQNTFISRKVLKYYSVLPFIGRMDDIWGGYILQSFFPNSIVYNRASVFQDRNKQDLIKNLESEIIGYRNTLNLLNNLKNFTDIIPKETQVFFDEYKKHFN